ncbi:MAG: oxidoreductase [Bacteroidetes bacterium]|nr:oxidoreductase [Bacteroidota bacterium]
MNKLFFLLLLILYKGLAIASAQDLQIFDLRSYEVDSTHSIAFISLSEIYPLSENADSLATPDLSDMEVESASNFNYIILDSAYRKRFLRETNVSETDKLFVYDYATNSFHVFVVKELKVVACLNIYGGDWPYSQYDYMIGFELNQKDLKGFDEYFTSSFAHIGKENPFVHGKVKPIIWKKIETGSFPYTEYPNYDTLYAGKCVKGDAYTFQSEGWNYFVQDYYRIADNWPALKRLVVIDGKTMETVCDKLFYSGESASFAPLEEQWTGKLFKNRSPVIFGFHYFTFGCPSITFLNTDESEVYINCDNRH